MDNSRRIKFQFHKGTIKTALRKKSFYPSNKFQFHKGTIKTNEYDRFATDFWLFQFHKGTIKTRPSLLYPIFVNQISIP